MYSCLVKKKKIHGVRDYDPDAGTHVGKKKKRGTRNDDGWMDSWMNSRRATMWVDLQSENSGASDAGNPSTRSRTTYCFPYTWRTEKKRGYSVARVG
jgi:hypothetical protein